MSATSTRTRRLDPDALAAMEEERRFLLRSITDLDAEHAAGDIDDADYEALRDDYTRRAAATIRAIEERQAAFSATPGVRGRQVLVWIVGLALLGGLSGVLIARSSGARSGGETITGGVRQSVVSQLNSARNLLGDQDRWDEAIDIYDDVLEEQPSSAEARTYRAWLQYRSGAEPQGPLDEWAEVVTIQPDYGDAIVFTAIVLSDLGRWEQAEEVLESIDPATAPPETMVLIAQRGLDGQIYGESRFDAIDAAAEPDLVSLDLTIDQALAAAGYLLTSDRDRGAVAALKLYRAIRSEQPDHAAASSREALILANVGDVEEALTLLDGAVEAHPDDAEARLSRATVLLSLRADADITTACADLEALDGLDELPEGFADQAEQIGAQAGCS